MIDKEQERDIILVNGLCYGNVKETHHIKIFINCSSNFNVHSIAFYSANSDSVI